MKYPLTIAVSLVLGCASTAGGEGADGTPPATSDAGPPLSCLSGGCTAAQRCCLLNGQCYDPANEATACPRPTPPAGAPRACTANSQCGASEYCLSDNVQVCQGVGTCRPTNNCGSCQGTQCAVCGCDGRTYANLQTACAAGVRISFASGACGASQVSDAGVALRVPCGRNEQCGSGQRCCPITGTCMPDDCADCCRPPPEGTLFPCRDNNDCKANEYCRGEGCGTPGGCVRRENRGRCGGVSSPVCGCDGSSYINECWARVSGARVRSSGMCPTL